jgi:hypothetical protein
MKTIKLLQIKETGDWYLRPGDINHYIGGNGFLDGVELRDNNNRYGMVISKDSKLQYETGKYNISHYENNGITMSKEEYDSKPTYYDEDSTDEETLRAIANKKEVQGFEAVYFKSELKDYKIEVLGYIENTTSSFITCTIKDQYASHPIVYTVHKNRITTDEYSVLAEKYKDQAKFEKLDRAYLRFNKVDGNFVFDDTYPFSEGEYNCVFTNLEDAQKKEEEIRILVRKAIEKHIFRKGLNDLKKTNIISYLTKVKKAKTRELANSMLDLLIDDLNEYKNNIEL